MKRVVHNMKKKNLFLILFSCIIMMMCIKSYNAATLPTDIYNDSFVMYAECNYIHNYNNNNYTVNLRYANIKYVVGGSTNIASVNSFAQSNAGIEGTGTTTTLEDSEFKMSNFLTNNDINNNGTCPSKLFLHYEGDNIYYDFNSAGADNEIEELNLYATGNYPNNVFKYDGGYWHNETHDFLIYIDSNKVFHSTNFTSPSTEDEVIYLLRTGNYLSRYFVYKNDCSSSQNSAEIDAAFEQSKAPFDAATELVNGGQYIKKTYNGGSANQVWEVVSINGISQEKTLARISEFERVFGAIGFSPSTPNSNVVASITSNLQNVISNWKTTVENILANACDTNIEELQEKIRKQTNSLNSSLTYTISVLPKLFESYSNLIKYAHDNHWLTDYEYAAKSNAASVYQNSLQEAKENMVSENQTFYLGIASQYGGVTSTYNTELDGCGLLGDELIDILDTILWYIRIAGVVLAIILSLIDYIKAATGFDDKAMASTNKRFITRFILVAVLFLIPALLSFMLKALNISTTSGSIDCLTNLQNEI